jgi:Tol biopolymer transport system component
MSSSAGRLCFLAAVVATAATSLVGCGSGDGGGAREEALPAAGAGGDSGAGWELVYDLKVDDNTDLFVVSAAEATPRRLTENPKYDGMPRFTPDGERIVFSSRRTGNWQLFEISAEGGEARRIRTNRANEYQADPSPDGATLAFLTNLDGPERLVLMDSATGDLRELVRHGRKTIFGNPSWRPDGGQIAFSSNWRIGHQIYVVDVASGETRRLSPLTSGGCEPRFTRDGSRVCYVSRGHLGRTSRLVAHDLETGDEEVLVDWPAMNYDPAFSPDGSEIAFASDVSGEFAIYRQRLRDGKAWRVTHGAGEARYPDYRPPR